MADWIRKDNVRFQSLYQRMPMNLSGEYQLWLRVNDNKDRYDINIESSNLKKELTELKEGITNRCYFAFGMQDIDIYRINDGRFGITHSPYEGLNVQLILADGELDKLLYCLE